MADKMNIDQMKLLIGITAGYANSKSTCPRRQIGCMLLDEQDQVISIGHNHSSNRGSNCRINPCVGAGLPRGENTTAQGKCESDLHAETVAILGLTLGIIAHTAVINCPPCKECAEALLKHGIERVIVPLDMLDRDNSRAYLIENGVQWVAV